MNHNKFAASLITHFCLFHSERAVAPKFLQSPVPMEVIAGDAFELEFPLMGTVPIKVSWAKGSREIRSVGNYKLKFLDNIAHLVVLKSEMSDCGIYTCKATNEAGSDTCNVEVVVKDRPVPPTFTKKLKPQGGALNTIVVLECKLSGSTPMDISWLRDEVKIIDGGRSIMSFEDETATLTILELQPSDGGNYTCKAMNTAGVAASTASLSIIDPPGFLRAIESKEMLPGTAVRFVSVIKGGEPISVIWYKNGQEIRPTRNCSMSFIERTATLLLDAVNLGASGEYICEAVNPAGKETCKAVLSIKGVSKDIDILCFCLLPYAGSQNWHKATG
uniref:Ig-like domain-containing protein n=1 Tax=Eptatretus burgeri TaxID=7764 RepID=A0A8C4QUL9_EPTBU